MVRINRWVKCTIFTFLLICCFCSLTHGRSTFFWVEFDTSTSHSSFTICGRFKVAYDSNTVVFELDAVNRVATLGGHTILDSLTVNTTSEFWGKITLYSPGGGVGFNLTDDSGNNRIVMDRTGGNDGFFEILDSGDIVDVSLYADAAGFYRGGNFEFSHSLDIVGEHHYYGILFGVHASSALSLPVQNQWERVTNFETVGIERGITGTVSGIEDGLTISSTGVYECHIHVCFTGTVNTEYEVSISTTGVRTEIMDNTIHTHRKIGASNDAGSMSCFGYIHLAADTKVYAYIRSITGNSKSFTYTTIGMSLKKL